MTNKFQEALDRLHTSIYDYSVYLNYSSSAQPFEADISTLQELIDQQGDYMSYQDLKAEYEQELAKLSKALDKAIDIFNFQEICPNVLFGFGLWECPNKNELEHVCDCDECWKDYLLKESE